MKQKPLNVLLVEDNAGDARLIREMLHEGQRNNFTLTHLMRMSECEKYLANNEADIVLLDMGLPDEHGLNTVRRAYTAAPEVPIIVLTGLDDETLAANAMQEGAQDYLIKGQIENRALPRFLRHAMERHRMLAENERMREQQLQLKDEFLSHVSHELRSPLTSIYSFASIIADNLAGDTTPRQADFLQIILRNVQQLQSMIEDLLEVTKAQTGKLSIELERTSVAEAVVHTVDAFQAAAAAKRITLSFNASLNLPMAYADPMRLKQILTILLDNALKFTPAGGAIAVLLRLHEEGASHLLVEVCDTGYGMSPETAARIFERLYQAADDAGYSSRRGLGLGLHIAKQLVERLGGKIWVTSEPHKGSHFFFTVPIFSLAHIIGPVLKHEKKSGEAIALLAVNLSARDGSPEVPKETMESARRLLQQCLRPDTDLLLPNMDSTTKIFFVVAYTQEHGAGIIAKRIQAHLSGSDLLQHEGLTFTVSHSFLEPLSKGEDESAEVFAERIGAQIQDNITSTAS